MKINVVFNKYISNYQKALEFVESRLISKNVEFKVFELDSMENFGEFTLVIGGDGTLLRAARFYSEWQVPVLGINIESLNNDDISKIEIIIKNE